MRDLKFRAAYQIYGRWHWIYSDEKGLYLFFGIVESKQLEPQQYTGLKDKQTLTDIYEGDIIDTEGNIRGNIYESPEVYKTLTTSVVAGVGYEDWEIAKQRLVRQGKLIAEQSNLPQILRELG